MRTGRPPKRVQQRLEGGFVDIDGVTEPQRLGLGQADRRQFRRAEHRAGHMDVIGPGGVVLESRLHETHGFVNCHRRQLQPVGDIADGINVRIGGAGIGIDLHLALLAQFDAGLLDMQRQRVGQAPDRQHDLVAIDLAALVGFGMQIHRRAFRSW